MIIQKSLVDLAYDEIKREIAAGSLAPGERILEAHLAEHLGVSRPPLREALRILAARHIIEMTPRRGYRVVGLTAEDAGEIYSLRTALEEFAVQLIAKRLPDLDLVSLAATVETMWTRGRSGDELGVVRAHRDFHTTLVALAGHRRLTQSYATLMEQMELHMIRNLASGADSDGVLLQACARHQTLLETIEKRDPERTFAALREHAERRYLPSAIAAS